MGADDDPLRLRATADPADIAEYLIGHRGRRLRITPPFAIVTRLRERTQEILPYPLTRDLDQTQVGNSGHSGTGLVGRHRIEQRVVYLVAILFSLHVDKVDDDDAADPTQLYLIGHFFCR